MFKHNTWGNHLEVPDCKPDSPNVLFPECFAGLQCLPVLESSEDAVVEEQRREVAKKFGRGAPLGD